MASNTPRGYRTLQGSQNRLIVVCNVCQARFANVPRYERHVDTCGILPHGQPAQPKLLPDD